MTITTDQLTQFRALLKNEEKSAATLNKYLRDIQRFALWLGDTPLERDAMLDYKADLMRHYAAGSVNSILAAYSQVYVVVLGIYYKLQTFLYLPANGFVQGMRPLIGYNFGAREMKRVKKSSGLPWSPAV